MPTIYKMCIEANNFKSGKKWFERGAARATKPQHEMLGLFCFSVLAKFI